MKYRVLLEQDEDGVFIATCPSLPGAIKGYLQSLRKHGEPIPPSIMEEVVEVTGGGSCRYYLERWPPEPFIKWDAT